MALVLAIVVVAAVGLFLSMNRSTPSVEQPDASLRTLLAAQGFQLSDLLLTESLTMALDESQRRIAFVSRAPNQRPVIHTVSHAALMAVAILRDEKPVVEVRRTGAPPVSDHPALPTGLDPDQLGGMSPGVGMLVSGLEGTAQINARLKLSRLELRVLTGDGAGGIGSEYTVRVLDLQRPDYLSTFWLRPQITSTELWYRRIGLLLQQAEGELAEQVASSPIPPTMPAAASPRSAPAAQDQLRNSDSPESSTFVADEISKLAGLMQRGLITNEQFIQQRDRLLGSPSGTEES